MASGSRGHARERERERERHDAASRTRAARHGEQRRQREARSRERARVDDGSDTCKRVCPSLARRPASPATARRRGATARSTSARSPGHPHGQGSSRPRLGWPRAVVQASVKCGGAARRRGGRRRRRRDVEEVEEAREVGILGDGGSGSSHGRLRSSRQTALPRAAPLLLLPPCSPFFPGGSVCGQGSNSPRRLGLGVAPGVSTTA
jgi:hypothetical protein